jgi:RimJ/RimL family protein N-acetyltransferase
MTAINSEISMGMERLAAPIGSQIIGNDRARGLAWAIPRLGCDYGHWDNASCLILEKGNDIAACVVYNHFYPENSVEISVAAVEGGRWLTRPFLKAVFHFPFVEWKLRRVGASIAADNHRSLKFCQHTGFVQEGRIREGAKSGVDLLILGMLKGECRYI